MLISDIFAKAPRNKRKKRIGRGIGSGHGKTSGRGTKGMGAHSSDTAHKMSEGGQMPLVRRIPKRGFSNARFRTEYQVVNVDTLEERFEAGAKVTAQALADRGLIHDARRPVKILGTGELTKKLEVEVSAFSGSAAEKIVKAGGQVRKLEEEQEPAVEARKPRAPKAEKAKAPQPEAQAEEQKPAGKKGEKKQKGEKKD